MQRDLHSARSVFWALSIIVLSLAGCGDKDDPVSPGALTPEPFTLAGSTTIIPPTAAAAIQAYDPASGAMTLTETPEFTAEVSVGSILIGQHDAVAPDGFLRKVTSVTSGDGTLTLETESALMTEAFEQMAISDTLRLRPSQITTSTLHNGTTVIPAKDDETFIAHLDCVVHDHDGNLETTADQIKFVGQYAFTASLFAGIDIARYTLEKLEIGMETDQEIQLDVLANTEWEFEDAREFDLWDIRLEAIQVGGAVWVVPTLSVEAHVHGDLTVTFEAGMTCTQEIRTGFGYDRTASPDFYTISENSQEFTFTPPQIATEFEFTAGASLNASCLLYGVVGPYLAGKTSFHYESVLRDNPCGGELTFDLDAVHHAVIGVAGDTDVIDLEWNSNFELYIQSIGNWVFPLGGAVTIVINPDPDSLGASWSIVGACGFSERGAGDRTLTGLHPGEYTLTWGEVSGWITPGDSQQTLTADETTTFSEIYVDAGDADTGTIVVNPYPDPLNAPWILEGPGNETGNGDTTLLDMTAGVYTLTWGDVSGWITPADSSLTLAVDDTLTFDGVYLELGTVVIDPKPDSLNAPWELWGPEEYYTSGSGDLTLTDMMFGIYTLTWGDLTNWFTPLSTHKNLTPGATIVFDEAYREMVLIQAGTFIVGSPAGELGRDSDETPHAVTLTRGFYMLECEVTEDLWARVMESDSSNSQLPQNYLRWDDAVDFCNALSIQEGWTPVYTIHGVDGDVTWNRSADGYRLPTEAEWEYACRAGSQTAFANGSITSTDCTPLDANLDQMGWYCGNSGSTPHAVCQKQPNAWGLSDLHGNVWEWTWDGYRADYQNLPAVDPVHDVGHGDLRVLRGGAWSRLARMSRSADRSVSSPGYANSYVGFRPVRSAF